MLAASWPEISRSRLKQLIEAGALCVDGKPVADPALKTRPGQQVALALPRPEPATPQGEDIPLTIVFEDKHVIVIDKQAGLVVHPAAGNRDGTLVNALISHCGDTLAGIGGELRPGIVHRIDKDTTGLMVVAKSEKAHTSLGKQFAAHAVTRVYKALVWGVPRLLAGTIDADLGRSPLNRQKVAVLRIGGKPARTHYKVVETFGATAALVECRLATGRTHQIRVHLSSIGCPLVGDATYARKPRKPADALDAALAGFPRQALDAFTLGFEHPETGERLRFARAHAPDLAALEKRLASLAPSR